MAKNIPERSEVRVEDTWDLSALYVSKEAWEKDLAEIGSVTKQIAGMQGRVTSSAAELLSVLEQSAKAEELLGRAFSYAERLYDQDQKNTEHQAMSQNVYRSYAEYQSATSFVVPELLSADEAVIDRYIAEEPALSLYREQIAEIRRTKDLSLIHI